MQKIIQSIIISVWFINGFYCKILSNVPRHQEIVTQILNEEYAREITFTIGVLEIMMAIWILTNYKSDMNAIMQIVIITYMNIIEFFFANELLLFGNINIVFAILFCSTIYYLEFILKIKKNV